MTPINEAPETTKREELPLEAEVALLKLVLGTFSPVILEAIRELCRPSSNCITENSKTKLADISSSIKQVYVEVPQQAQTCNKHTMGKNNQIAQIYSKGSNTSIETHHSNETSDKSLE